MGKCGAPIPVRGGEEQDMLGGWRRLLAKRAGRAAAAKRSYNRRVRRWRRAVAAEEV